MLDTPEIVRTTAQKAAVIHLVVPRSEIQNVFAPALHELESALKAQGVARAGPMFAHYLRIDPATFDFEVGLPVATPIEPAGRVKAGELPAAKVARTVYRGAYEGLHAAWIEFGEWVKSEGLSARSDLWERYVTGPESSSDPSTWRTELNRPLES